MSKDMKSFRFEPFTCRQLEELSELYGRSQARIIEDLINYYHLAVIEKDPYFFNDNIVRLIDSALSR